MFHVIYCGTKQICTADQGMLRPIKQHRLFSETELLTVPAKFIRKKMPAGQPRSIFLHCKKRHTEITHYIAENI
jgi:hypothetical protein